MFEAIMNVLVGMIVSFSLSQLAHYFQTEIQYYIWSGFTWDLSLGSNIIMTFILTVASIMRGYAVRRYFNMKHAKTIDIS